MQKDFIRLVKHFMARKNFEWTNPLVLNKLKEQSNMTKYIESLILNDINNSASDESYLRTLISDILKDFNFVTTSEKTEAKNELKNSIANILSMKNQ